MVSFVVTSKTGVLVIQDLLKWRFVPSKRKGEKVLMDRNNLRRRVADAISSKVLSYPTPLGNFSNFFPQL